ncbi:hypothetical protein KC359_g143 [Hortaea werneckii]|nr:hypothetical protein KC359_g143 [Hortaea werneckii]
MAAIDTKLLKCMVKGSVEDLVTAGAHAIDDGFRWRSFSLVGKSKRLYRGGRLWEVMYERLPDLHGKCGNGLLSIVSFSASSD